MVLLNVCMTGSHTFSFSFRNTWYFFVTCGHLRCLGKCWILRMADQCDYTCVMAFSKVEEMILKLELQV